MQSDEIFLLRDGGERVDPLAARTFRAGVLDATLEKALQILIEKSPGLIQRCQMVPGNTDSARFVLLRREMPIGDWSLDHLFVDEQAIPTLVEAKLAGNPEARRAVIGQIIEYAANAAEFWDRGRLREKAAEYWSNQKDG